MRACVTSRGRGTGPGRIALENGARGPPLPAAGAGAGGRRDGGSGAGLARGELPQGLAAVRRLLGDVLRDRQRELQARLGLLRLEPREVALRYLQHLAGRRGDGGDEADALREQRELAEVLA